MYFLCEADVGHASCVSVLCRRAKCSWTRRWVRAYQASRRLEHNVTEWWTHWVMSTRTPEVFLIVSTLTAGLLLHHSINDTLGSTPSRTR